MTSITNTIQANDGLLARPTSGAGRAAAVKGIISKAFTDFWRRLLIFTSFATTAYGALQLYVTGTSEEGALGWLAYVIPLVSAGFLHKLIVDWFNVFAREGRPLLLTGAVGLQLIAIMLSFGTHWTHFEGERATIGSFEETQQAIVREIGAERAAFRALAEQAKEIAEYSDERASTELKDGRTCGPVGAGDGPRRRLRQEDQRIFADARARAEQRLRDLDAIMDGAAALVAHGAHEAARASAELKRIVNRMLEFEADPFIGSLKRTVEDRLARGRAPIPVEAGNSRAASATFSCPDPVLAQHLQSTLAAIVSIHPIGEVVFTDFTKPRSGVRAALSRLLDSVGSSLDSVGFEAWSSPWEQRVRLINAAAQPQTQMRGLQPNDYLALSWAVFVEALLFLSYTIGGRRPPFPDPKGLTDILEALEKPRKGTLKELWLATQCRSEFLEILDRHTFWKWRGKGRIFVPVDGGDEEAIRLRRFLELAAASGFVRRGVAGWLLPWVMAIGWTPQHRKRIFAASQVRSYLLSNGELAVLVLQCLGSESMPKPDRRRHGGPPPQTFSETNGAAEV
ncbi:MAG: hypothetical protein L0Y60_03120 [Beijerinckiaceae bacterium]|nr:hypothetical protein [Beijerinckiaceae bacterium]